MWLLLEGLVADDRARINRDRFSKTCAAGLRGVLSL
jgi:hypothetical protein